jgi:hypothetical protein
MLVRVAFGVGLLALGYFVGREIGRNESLRHTLDQGDPPEDPAPGKARGPEAAAESEGPDSKVEPQG